MELQDPREQLVGVRTEAGEGVVQHARGEWKASSPGAPTTRSSTGTWDGDTGHGDAPRGRTRINTRTIHRCLITSVGHSNAYCSSGCTMATRMRDAPLWRVARAWATPGPLGSPQGWRGTHGPGGSGGRGRGWQLVSPRTQSQARHWGGPPGQRPTPAGCTWDIHMSNTRVEQGQSWLNALTACSMTPYLVLKHGACREDG